MDLSGGGDLRFSPARARQVPDLSSIISVLSFFIIRVRKGM